MVNEGRARTGHVDVVPEKLVGTDDVRELNVSAIDALTDIKRIRRLNATEVRLPNKLISGRCGLEAENARNRSVAQSAMGGSNAVAQVRLRQ